MAKRVGIVTIGQAPRTDVEPVFHKNLPEIEMIQAGALDQFDKSQIDQELYPQADDYVLITRLRTGESVILGRTKVEPLLQQKIDQLETKQCDPILVLCTGVFEGLTTKKSFLIEPDRLLPPIVAMLIQDRQLGIIAPLSEQIKSLEEKWSEIGLSPVIVSASPYSSNKNAFQQAATSLVEQGAEVIIMDCMGYVEEMKEWVAEASRLPVILSNALVAKLMSELA